MKEVEIMGPKRLSRGDVEHPSFGVFKISLDAHWMGMMEISGCASSWEETRWCPRSIPSFFFSLNTILCLRIAALTHQRSLPGELKPLFTR